jgi:ABC-type antimicrobial peptide transport system permease subunit
MYRLGLELTLKGGREALARLLLTISAVAVGVVILLGVFAGYHALQQTSNRPSWKSTSGSPITAPPSASSNVLLWNYSQSIYQGQSIEHVQLAAAGPNAPVVPGVAALPEPGEFYVSPALASLLRTVPRDQLGDRFPGRQIGTIGPVGLSSPNQLAIVVGSTPQQLLQQHGTVAVSRISSAAHASSGSREVLLLAALAVLFPLLILINTATRLSAARREERYAAMRLIGATPRQINVLASVDAVVGALLGALLGSLVFVAVRPALASSSFAGTKFFPGEVTPTLRGYIGTIVAVPCVAMVGSLLSLRRVQISPLGVTRKSSVAKRPRAWRLVPLLAGVLLFPRAATQVSSSLRQTGDSNPLPLFVGLLLIMVGIVLSGSWLTTQVAKLVARTTRSASSLLATRRLADNPKQAFRTVSSLVLAVFIGSFVSALVPALNRAQNPPGQGSLSSILRVPFNTDPLVPGVPPEGAAALVRAMESYEGAAVVPLYANPAFTAFQQRTPGADPPAAPGPPAAFIATCASLAQIGALGSCPRDAPSVVVTAENVLAGESPLSIYQSLPVVTPSSPQSLEDVGTLSLAGMLIEVDDPSTLERIRTYLTTYEAASRHPKAGQTSGDGQYGTSVPETIGEVAVASNAQNTNLERAVLAFIVLTLVTAGCSLAISIGGGLLERRRPFTLLRVSGVSRGTLDVVILLEAALPLVAGSLIAAGIGLGLGIPAIASILRALAPDGATIGVYPGAGYYFALGGGLAAALGLVAATLPVLHRMTKPEEVRFE